MSIRASSPAPATRRVQGALPTVRTQPPHTPRPKVRVFPCCQNPTVSAIQGAANARTTFAIGEIDPLYNQVRELTVGTPVLVSPVFRNGVWEVGAVAFPTTETGVLAASTAYRGRDNAGTLTVGETVFRRAAILSASAATAELASVNSEITLTLDTYGYVVNTTTAVTSTRAYFFVERAGLSAVIDGLVRNVVRGFWPDGTPGELVLAPGQNYSATTTSMPAGFSFINGQVMGVGGTGNDRTLSPATRTSITATNSSVAATLTGLNATTISARQPAIAVGGTVLPFAAEAKLFFWDANADSGAGRFTIRDNDQTVATLTNVNLNRAVVEYRAANATGVVSALLISQAAVPDLDPNAIIFLRNNSGASAVLDGRVHALVNAFDLDGVAIAGGIGISGSTGGLPSGSAGFYNFSLNETTGLYTVRRLDDTLTTTLGLFAGAGAAPQGLVATANALDGGVLTIGLGGPATMTSITTGTVIHDFRGDLTGRPTGTRAVNTLQELNELMNVPGNGGQVRVSVAFDRTLAGWPAKVIYIWSSAQPLPPL